MGGVRWAPTQVAQLVPTVVRAEDSAECKKARAAAGQAHQGAGIGGAADHPDQGEAVGIESGFLGGGGGHVGGRLARLFHGVHGRRSPVWARGTRVRARGPARVQPVMYDLDRRTPRGCCAAAAAFRRGASGHARVYRALTGRGRCRPGYSAAFISKPCSSMSAGSTGYSPEKQASQYCGCFGSRPPASPTAR